MRGFCYADPMEKILVDDRPAAAATVGNLTAQFAVPEALMDRLADLGESLRQIADRISDQLEASLSWKFGSA
jgi:hypothetical protein